MIKAYHHGLGYTDLFTLPQKDQSKHSAARLQRLWDEEQDKAKKAKREPSFSWACIRFCQRRIIIAAVFFVFAAVLQFLIPVS
jgi:hypothetical protein